jgi:hypothetical protein
MTGRCSTATLGQVVRIDDEEGALIASFDGREVSYPFGELDTLVPPMPRRSTSHRAPSIRL